MSVSAQMKWIDGLQFVGRVGNGPAIILDNPEGGSGPSPMPVVLMGIAGCSGMDVVSILKKKRSTFNDLKINITGDRAEDHPKRYTNIHLEFLVYGKGIKPKDVERAVELSVTKYCGAIGSINAEVDYSYRILEEEE